MTAEQTQRTRELIQRLTHSSLSEVKSWNMIPGRVAVLLGREASLTGNGQLAFFTAINLLARLHPVVTEIDVHIETDATVIVHAPLFDSPKISGAIRNFSTSLNSPVAVTLQRTSSHVRDAAIVLTAGALYSGTQVSFGSDGWDVHLDSEGSCGFSDKFNPVGSMSAACLAASEAFKRVFITKANSLGLHPDSLPTMRLLNGRSSISTLTYVASTNDVPNPDLPEELEIGRLTVVGAGAGGGACLYALATLRLSGELWVVDPDVVNLHNLNRYIYASDQDARTLKVKVNVVSQFLGSKILKCRIFDTPFLGFKSTHPDWPRDLVLSTVDTVEARHAIQWEIPRVILDAAVSQSAFYVHRVELGHSACLKCTHTVSSEQTDIIRAISAVIGMDYIEVCRIYFDNMPLNEEIARRIGQNVAHRGLRPPTAGMTLRDWVMVHCGQLKLTAGPDMTLPIPFATVLPGVLLAGEIIKERYFPRCVVKHNVNHDVFGLPSDWLVTPLYPKQDCPVCGDETVKKIYRDLYSKSGTKWR